MGRKRVIEDDEKAAKGFNKANNGVKRGKGGHGNGNSKTSDSNVSTNNGIKRRVGKPRSARPTKPLTVSLSLSEDEIEDPPKEVQKPKIEPKAVKSVPPSTRRARSTPPIKEEGSKSCIQGDSELNFVEPPLSESKIVTGQTLEEPPNMFVKRELSSLSRKRGPKSKASHNPNSSEDQTERVKEYKRKLANLDKIETTTKLSSERGSLKRRKKGDKRKAKNGSVTENLNDSPPPLEPVEAPNRRGISAMATSPVKKSKTSRRIKDTDSLQPTPDVELEKSESQSESNNVNQDFCSCCGLPGMFLCCETCPRSFHFHCLNPPMDPNKLPDSWFCKECIGKKLLNEDDAKPNTNVGILDKLLTNVVYENPISFRLPREIVDAFQGISMDKIGDFEDDSFKEEKQYKELVRELDDPLNGVYDANGNPYLCYKCGESKKSSLSDMMKCDYCPLSWHLDCLDPPMASVKKLGSKWKCPNHADTIVKLRRKMRNQSTISVDSTKATDIPADAHVNISNVDDRLFQFKDRPNHILYEIPEELKRIDDKLRLGNVTYELKEEDIILDFLKGAKIKKINDNKNNASLFRNLEPTTKSYIKSLSALSGKPIFTEEMKQTAFKDLMTIVEDEITTENGVEKISKEELRELLLIKRLMERKGKGKLLEFLKS